MLIFGKNLLNADKLSSKELLSTTTISKAMLELECLYIDSIQERRAYEKNEETI